MSFMLKDLVRLYKQCSPEIDDPLYAYHGHGAMCIHGFYAKIFVPSRVPGLSDLDEAGLRYCLKHIEEGMSPEKANGVIQDCRKFLCFIHYGSWSSFDWSYIFQADDELPESFSSTEYRKTWSN